MAITQTTLLLLNTAYRGAPFADLSVSGINTLLLNTAWRGVPYVSTGAASEVAGGSGGDWLLIARRRHRR